MLICDYATRGFLYRKVSVSVFLPAAACVATRTEIARRGCAASTNLCACYPTRAGGWRSTGISRHAKAGSLLRLATCFMSHLKQFSNLTYTPSPLKSLERQGAGTAGPGPLSLWVWTEMNRTPINPRAQQIGAQGVPAAHDCYHWDVI